MSDQEEKDMNKSIRLSPKNPDEKKVIDFILNAEANGHSFKDVVMTLILDAQGIVTDNPLSIANELNNTLKEMKRTIETMQTTGIATPPEPPTQSAMLDNAVSTSDALVRSLTANAKKGRRRQ